jgi:hypothetical protein
MPIFRFFLFCFAGTFIANVVMRPNINYISQLIFFAYPIILGLTAVSVWLSIKLFPVYLSVDGIRSYTAWATYRTLPWSDCKEFKVFKKIGLPYLSIRNSRSQGIHVALYLTNMKQFCEDVRTLAGADHPLVKVLLNEIQSQKNT